MTALQIVPPAKIQSTLDALWDAKENKNKMRASLFNIIFFTEKSSREDYVRKIAYKLIEKFPARIFFISVDPDSADDLKTAVSVLSTKQGDFDITCDLIEISASGKEEAKVPLLLLPHIVPDLPVFLVWAEDPTKNHSLCEQLKQFATRIIFDSESTEDLGVFSQSVLEMKRMFSCEIADLNWARLDTWRTLISSTFSDPEKLEKLKNATSIEITFNAQETPFFCHTKIQSIYLQAWIASRLKWIPTNTNSSLLSFSYQLHDKNIEVTLTEVKNAKLPPGMILSLSIQTADGDHFLFERESKASHQIAFQHSSPSECALPTRLLVAKGESGQSLVNEICHKGTSQHYIDALKIIASGSLS
ncbi:MAG: glucose-6-phosphate dehydrogenase assembly protein OpcA [Chlamydiota bacterium]